MNDKLIFLPVLLQILLAVLLYIRLAGAKKKAISDGEVNQERRGLFDDAWPEGVIKINNCIRNQFEIPVLFYTLIVTLWLLNAVNMVAHILAWVYLISRCVHAYIQTGSNYTPLRLRYFKIGVYCVIGLTVIAFIGILT